MISETTVPDGRETTDETYLQPTSYIDSDHPIVVATARELIAGATTDIERVGRIYHHVRDLPYDVLASFRYLAEGRTAASDVLEHGVAFCMGKASSFVALSRAAGIPARVAFQALDAPKMEFLSPEVRPLWGGPVGRPLPWHSLGEAFLNGRWIKLDATIDPPTATRLGKPYTVPYDGHTEILTVEGPVLRENGSYADYPVEVAEWYLQVAREVLDALGSTAAHERVAADDVLWSGPDPELVRRHAVPEPTTRRATRGGQITSINPATEEVLARFDTHSPVAIDDALERASTAARQWRSTPVSVRAEHLQRAAALLRGERDRLATLITEEMGKPIAEAEAEVDKSASCCEYYATEGPKLLAHQPVATAATRSHIAFDPLGLVLAVMPWNFPLWQVFRFAPPALLAGNGAVLKHASNVPGCALAIADIWDRAGCPPGLFTTLLVGPDAVPDLVADHRIHALTLTGSTEVGATVAAMAAHHLKPQVLELGGSDPFIVLADADVPAAAAAAVTARMLNAGQSCISAKRFIVEDAVVEEFTEAFAAGVAALTVGNPLDRDVQVGPLARSSLRTDLINQVQRSTDAGARVVAGGTVPDGPGYFYTPAVLDRVTPDMAVAAEETFGPVAAVITAKSSAHAVEIANSTEFGLGAALWTSDLDHADRLVPAIEAGAVFVNGIVASDPRLPFGGTKRSGYGRELGAFGLRQFTNVKAVWIGPAQGAPSTPLSE